MARNITPQDLERARRLKAIWDQKEATLKLSQIGVARTLGWSQPAVSQYLKGKVALNTDAILKFAQLLGVSPTAIDPSLSSLTKGEVQKKRKLRVMTASGLSVGYIDAPASSEACFIVKIENDDYAPRFAVGDLLVVNPDRPLMPDDTVVIWGEDTVHIGKLKEIDTNRAVLQTIHGSRILPVTQATRKAVVEYAIL